MNLYAPILSLWSPGWPELVILGVLALLIFGGRLPEVGRSLGRGIVEFKRGLQGIEDDVEKAGNEKSEQNATDTRKPLDHPQSAPTADTTRAADPQPESTDRPGS